MRAGRPSSGSGRNSRAGTPIRPPRGDGGEEMSAGRPLGPESRPAGTAEHAAKDGAHLLLRLPPAAPEEGDPFPEGHGGEGVDAVHLLDRHLAADPVPARLFAVAVAEELHAAGEL